ncbi:dynamin family protein [Rhodococcus antarcticus]|uniref:Dynamin family protein n=1 Tax=Rhodococcus antarcticus TaxID=2987751 RepID=A0ABY6NZK4_9NOCA|nr:dynamin family protein [Rhodococcus antarcticus]UZJ24835.1 dynamin family protein [Rhodococcus antarcticus]
MAERPLCRAVDGLCRELLTQVGPELGPAVHDVLDRLQAPLQVAVTGRLSSGKSTLVNALIGRKVAPTAAGECTRLVTRFTFGAVDRVDVVLHDGRVIGLGLDPDGTVPADVATRAGVALADVSHLEAAVTSDLLAELTVIDTPGLGSLERAPLAGVQHGAVAGAEAVLHVLTQSARADDAEALATFGADTAGREAGPATVLAVLTKVDTVAPESVAGSDGSVWGAGRVLAAEQARALGGRVVDVLPVVGLLAETCETGAFTAVDADALRTLAGTDGAVRTAMLLSADLFTTLECAVDGPTRLRLLDLLDLYGVGCALRALDADPEMATGRLRAALAGASGLAAVRVRLQRVLAARVDVLKAAAALGALAGLARGDTVAEVAVRDGVERLLRLPEAHQLRVAEALTLLTSGTVTLPADLTAEAVRLGTETDPGDRVGTPGASVRELTAVALERAGWWRSFASFGATPSQARIAHVVHRAYFLLWQQLTAGGPR